MSMDINTTEYHPDVHIASESQGFIRTYGSSLTDYLDAAGFLAEAGLELVPPAPPINTHNTEIQGFLQQNANPPIIDYNSAAFHGGNVQESSNSNETIREYVEIFSDNGSFVRIPEDVFNFPDAEAREAYLTTAKAYLNSITGYMEFSKKYSNSTSFEIPTSPLVLSNEVFSLLNNVLRANDVPVNGIPYDYAGSMTDPNAPQVETSQIKVTQESGEVINFNCNTINLARGIQICQPEEDTAVGVDHFIATSLWALGILAQEYPATVDRDVMLGLYLHYQGLGKEFGSAEDVFNYIEGIDKPGFYKKIRTINRELREL